MKPYAIQIEIDAAPDRVWQTLTQDMPAAPQAYGILRFEGELATDARFKLWSEAVPNRPFALKVEAFDPPTTMVWKAGMPLGLFSGTRTFTVSPKHNGSVFRMNEVFSGLLAGMLTRSMPDLTPSFETFAKALKRASEGV